MQNIAGLNPAWGSSSFSLGKKELSSGIVALLCLVSITDHSGTKSVTLWISTLFISYTLSYNFTPIHTYTLLSCVYFLSLIIKKMYEWSYMYVCLPFDIIPSGPDTTHTHTLASSHAGSPPSARVWPLTVRKSVGEPGTFYHVKDVIGWENLMTHGWNQLQALERLC